MTVSSVISTQQNPGQIATSTYPTLTQTLFGQLAAMKTWRRNQTHSSRRGSKHARCIAPGNQFIGGSVHGFSARVFQSKGVQDAGRVVNKVFWWARIEFKRLDHMTTACSASKELDSAFPPAPDTFPPAPDDKPNRWDPSKLGMARSAPSLPPVLNRRFSAPIPRRFMPYPRPGRKAPRLCTSTHAPAASRPCLYVILKKTEQTVGRASDGC